MKSPFTKFSTLFATRSAVSNQRRRSASLDTTIESMESRLLLTLGLVNAGSFGGAGSEFAHGLASDSLGNRYTTGVFQGTIDADPGTGTLSLVSKGSSDVFISKLAPDGSLIWAKSIGGIQADGSFDIAVDAAGNSYVVGKFDGSVDFDPSASAFNMTSANGSAFVLKLNSNGQFVWARQFGGDNTSVFAGSVALDQSGNVVLGGKFTGSADFNPDPVSTFSLSTAAASTSAFLLKMTSSGSFQWANATGGTGAIVNPANISVARDGSIVLAGSYSGAAVDFDPGIGGAEGLPPAFYNAFVSSLNANGTLRWNRTLTSPTFIVITSTAVDSAGNINLGGRFEGTVDLDPGRGVQSRSADSPIGQDAFVLQLNSSGAYSWDVRSKSDFGAPAFNSLMVDSDGAVVVSGIASGSARLVNNTEDISLTEGDGSFIAKISSTGQPISGSRFVGYMSLSELAQGPMGDIYAAGAFRDTSDLDPGAGEFLVTAQNTPNFDVFVGRFTSEIRTSALTAGTNEFLVRKNGPNIELIDKTSGVLLRSEPLVEVTGMEINGSNAKETLVVDFSGGEFSLPRGIRFNGNTNLDSLSVIGNGLEMAVYRSGLASGSAELQINGGVIRATGLDVADVSSMAMIRMETLGMTDALSLTPTVINGATKKSNIAGTSSGQSIVPLSFETVQSVTVDTGAKDLIRAFSNDTVSLAAGVLYAPGLREFNVSTGAGNDTVNLAGPDFSVIGETGNIQVQGGTGLDRLNVTGDVNWTLNPGQISNSAGSQSLFYSIETMGITGGSLANVIDASTFTGTAILDGAGGNDIIRGGFGNDTLYAGTGNDRVHGNGGNDRIYGQDGDDVLWGGDGDDLLDGGLSNDRISGGDGNDNILGQDGNDVLRGEEGNDSIQGNAGQDTLLGGDNDDVLSGGDGNDRLFGEDGNDRLLGGIGNDRLQGGAGDDLLTGDDGVDEYVFEGTSASDEMRLTRNSATSASYVGKPRGHASILERDTITNDASDRFSLNALAGDDLIAIDLTFSLLGTVDGSDGSDTCTSPAAWIKVSC